VIWEERPYFVEERNLLPVAVVENNGDGRDDVSPVTVDGEAERMVLVQ
jgi:hypothetical protein